jgi:hypothetical protein
MKSFHDPIIRLELPIIARIIRDETWLESERRGCPVSSNDPALRARICEIVLRIGHDMRTSLTAQAEAAANNPNDNNSPLAA